MIKNHTFKAKFTTKIEMSQEKSFNTHNEMTILYVHGFFSDPWGRKPEEVKAYCKENDLGFCRFELAGHGSDKNDIEKVDFNIWKNQILEIIDELITGPVIMVGSSLGGWLSLLAARERPARVKGVVGMAAAPDFTDDLDKLIFTPEQKQELKETGRLVFPMKDFAYIFTGRIFDTAQQNLLLKEVQPISCPLYLLQGTDDKNVLPDKPMKILQHVKSENVVIKWIKGSNHRLGRDIDILEMKQALSSLLLQL